MNNLSIIIPFVWPITVFISLVTMALIFRKPVCNLISLGIKLKHKDFEAVVGSTEDIDKATQQTQISSTANSSLDNFQPQLYNNNLINIVIENLKKEDNDLNLAGKVDSDYLYRRCAIFRILLEFEKVYSVIFGSQLFILKMLNQSPDGAPYKLIEQFFENTIKNQHDGFYDDFSFDQFMSFLIKKDLVTIANGNFQLTVFGKEFLIILYADGRRDTRPY